MHTRKLLFFAAIAVLDAGFGFTRCYGQDSLDVEWSQVCRAAAGRQMRVTMNAGNTVEGYCLSVNVDEISLQTPDHRAVRIARAAMERMVFVPQPRQMKALGRGMQNSLRTGFRALLTPNAPWALTLIPATLAWGAVAAPFCAIGDLFSRHPSETEIRPH